MLLQLNPPLPLVTPKGPGWCHLVIDHGIEHHLVWVVTQENGEIWSWENPKVRGDKNITWGRPNPEKPQPVKPEITNFDGDWNYVEDPANPGFWRVKGTNVTYITGAGDLIKSNSSFENIQKMVLDGGMVPNEYILPY